MQAMITGHVELDARPLAGVELALVDRHGETLAARTSDGQGRFSFAAPSGFAGGWVLAKLHEPIVGAAAAQVTAPEQPVVLSVSSRTAVTLQATIETSTGATLDWADVHLRPQALSGIAPELIPALALVGAGPSRRSAYHTVRVHEPRVSVRVLPGTYDLKVEHIVERPSSLAPAPPNWISDTLTLPGGTRAPEHFGAHRIEVARDLHVKVRLRVFEE